MEIIDLSQEIYPGMPVYPGLPEVKLDVHVTHEEWEGESDAITVTPGVNKISMGSIPAPMWMPSIIWLGNTNANQ